MTRQVLFDWLICGGFRWALVLLLGSVGSAQQFVEPRFSAPLELPAVETTRLASLTLSSRLYSQSSRGLADLRLFDSRDNLVSFVVRQQITQREERTTTQRAIASPELKFLEGNGLELRFSIDPERSPGPLGGLLIRTGLRKFERRADLEWDQGSGEWTALAKDVLLYDYSSVIDLRNLEIRLPQPLEIRQPSRFRLVIDKVTEAQASQVIELTRRLRGGNEEYREERQLVNRQPFRIEGLEAIHETRQIVSDSPLKSSYPSQLVAQEELQDEGCTRLIIESQGEPLTGFQLQTADDNFSRQVTIEAELLHPGAAASEFRTIGKGRISRIHLPGTDLDQMELSFPEHSSRLYRLTVRNADSPPLKISGVTASGNTYELYFLAEPGERYRLEYGGGERERPTFDTVAISTALEKRIASLPAKLGEATRLETGTSQPAGTWTVPLWVYWIAGVVLVALLASSLYSAAQRIEKAE